MLEECRASKGQAVWDFCHDRQTCLSWLELPWVFAEDHLYDGDIQRSW